MTGCFTSIARSEERRSPNDRPRVGVVGNGGIARAHAKGLKPLADIVAIADVDQQRLEKYNGEHAGGKAQQYTDYREMCRDPEIDAIFVGTPNQLHVPMALEAVRRDKHVLITKPLADSERAAARLVAAAEKAGVVNMTGAVRPASKVSRSTMIPTPPWW